MLKSILIPVHRTGWPFIIIFAVATVFLTWWMTYLGFLGLILTAWCIYFFRDPPRMTPNRRNLIISPADGVIQSIVEAPPPAELDMGAEPRTRIAVFMNVFNVHVNRIPIDGTIAIDFYRPGKFLNASRDKASQLNERQCLKVKTEDGKEVGFVQIAGLIARRIVCDLKVGDRVRAGERFGIIRFGSRVDIYLPQGASSTVIEGQTAIAGETVLSDLITDEFPRQGEKR